MLGAFGIKMNLIGKGRVIADAAAGQTETNGFLLLIGGFCYNGGK